MIKLKNFKLENEFKIILFKFVIFVFENISDVDSKKLKKEKVVKIGRKEGGKLISGV